MPSLIYVALPLLPDAITLISISEIRVCKTAYGLLRCRGIVYSHSLFTLSANGGGQGGGTGLYAIPAMRVVEGTKQGYVDIMPGECVDLAYANSKLRCGRAMREKSNCLTTSYNFYQYCGTADKPIFKVESGLIEIGGKPYPIKIKDGCYLIRKLSPVECERLQTLPDNYTAGVSNTQRYRQLGNGWTVDVIAHILGGLT